VQEHKTTSPAKMPKRKRSDDIDSEAAAVEWLFDILRPENECNSFDEIDEIKDVVQRFPHAIRVQNSHGYVPLHCACKVGWADEIVLFLIESYPESVKMVTVCSTLPLHFACQGKSSLTVIQTLVEAYPESVREQHSWDEDFRLNYACDSGCTDEVIQYLLQLWPEAGRFRTHSGQLPLESVFYGDQIDHCL